MIGLGINLWISLGSVLYGIKTPMSPSIGTDGCFLNDTLGQNLTEAVAEHILTSTLEPEMNTSSFALE